MLKKIILALATLAIVAVLFMIVHWQETPASSARRMRPPATRPRDLPGRAAATQPPDASALAKQVFNYRGANIPPGEAPRVRIYDRKGDAKIIFQATRWRPVGENEFHLIEPTARLMLPRGQLAYVRADEGRILLQRGDRDSDLNPKSGWFKGNVNIFIDRTNADWRKANAPLADPELHPEKVIKLWLEDVEFDLDFSWLKSEGPIVIQGREGELEGRGLLLTWNEVGREIKEIVIRQGRRARLRLTEMMDFKATPADAKAPAAKTVNAPVTPAPVKDAPASAEPRNGQDLSLLEPVESPRKPKTPSVKTYLIAFHDNVLAEQKEGIKVLSGLRAEVLELIRDVTPTELEPTAAAESRPAGTTAPAAATQPAAPAKAQPEKSLELRWTGQLTVTPVTEPNPPPDAGRRTHLLAKGSPVEIFDRQSGRAFCQVLEYHDESKQLWLRGSAKTPFRMHSGPQQDLSGETFFLDQNKGLARVEGRGHLLSKPPRQSDAALARSYLGSADLSLATQEDTEIKWERSAELTFGKIEKGPPSAQRKDLTELSSVLAGAYLRRAVFQGRPALQKAKGESIAAEERIEVEFMEPAAPPTADDKENRPVFAKTILAVGNVRMRNKTDAIACRQRLEVEMAVDEVGNNVPALGRAFGDVQVDLLNPKGRIKMRAADRLIAAFISVPKTLPPQEIDRLRAFAKKRNIQSDSPLWRKFEEKLRNRRELEIAELSAQGRVFVQSLEEKLLGYSKELEVGCASLECTFARGQNIERAWVLGSAAELAYVDTGDFYIRGPQVRLNMATESAEVPGEGLLRFHSRQDLDGRVLDEPAPIVVTWQERMSMNGREDYGLFSGAVQASSRDVTARGRELRLEFENLPKPPITTTQAAPVNRAAALPALLALPAWAWPANYDLWPTFVAVGRAAWPLAGSLKGQNQSSPTDRLTRQIRKRPVYLKIVGEAVIASQTMSRPPALGGPIRRLLAAALPAAWPPPPGPPTPQHTLSLVRAAGPQIAINLKPLEEYLMVEGAGNLLILDYRLPAERRGGARRADLLEGSLAPVNFDNAGPSQTQFRWQNSMTFLNNRNAALFEHEVEMVHLSGSEMVKLDELRAALQFDERQIQKIESRSVGLTCENFFVEFDRTAGRAAGGPSPLSRAAMLKSFEAKGRVLLEANNRRAEGEVAKYDHTSGIVQLTGSPQHPPQILEHDPATGRVIPWSGRSLQWNLRTKKITVFDSSILAPGR